MFQRNSLKIGDSTFTLRTMQMTAATSAMNTVPPTDAPMMIPSSLGIVITTSHDYHDTYHLTGFEYCQRQKS